LGKPPFGWAALHLSITSFVVFPGDRDHYEQNSRDGMQAEVAWGGGGNTTPPTLATYSLSGLAKTGPLYADYAGCARYINPTINLKPHTKVRLQNGRRFICLVAAVSKKYVPSIL